MAWNESVRAKLQSQPCMSHVRGLGGFDLQLVYPEKGEFPC